jgi:hypothetical protein
MQDIGLKDAEYWTLGCRILDFRMQDAGFYDTEYWTLSCRILDFRMLVNGL